MSPADKAAWFTAYVSLASTISNTVSAGGVIWAAVLEHDAEKSGWVFGIVIQVARQRVIGAESMNTQRQMNAEQQRTKGGGVER